MVCINQGFNGTALQLGLRKGRIGTCCFQNSWKNKKRKKQTKNHKKLTPAKHQPTKLPKGTFRLNTGSCVPEAVVSLRLTDVGYYLSRIYLCLPRWTWKNRRRRLEMVENCKILPSGEQRLICVLSFELWVTPKMKKVSLLTWQLLCDFIFVSHFLYLFVTTKVGFHCHHLSNLLCAAIQLFSREWTRATVLMTWLGFCLPSNSLQYFVVVSSNRKTVLSCEK